MGGAWSGPFVLRHCSPPPGQLAPRPAPHRRAPPCGSDCPEPPASSPSLLPLLPEAPPPAALLLIQSSRSGAPQLIHRQPPAPAGDAPSLPAWSCVSPSLPTCLSPARHLKPRHQPPSLGCTLRPARPRCPTPPALRQPGTCGRAEPSCERKAALGIQAPGAQINGCGRAEAPPRVRGEDWPQTLGSGLRTRPPPAQAWVIPPAHRAGLAGRQQHPHPRAHVLHTGARGVTHTGDDSLARSCVFGAEGDSEAEKAEVAAQLRSRSTSGDLSRKLRSLDLADPRGGGESELEHPNFPV